MRFSFDISGKNDHLSKMGVLMSTGGHNRLMWRTHATPLCLQATEEATPMKTPHTAHATVEVAHLFPKLHIRGALLQ